MLTGGTAMSGDGYKLENADLSYFYLGKAPRRSASTEGQHHHRERCRQEGRHHRGRVNRIKARDRDHHQRLRPGELLQDVWPSHGGVPCWPWVPPRR